MVDLNLPTIESGNTEEVYEMYRQLLARIHDNQRGAILDMYGNKVWEEPIEDYNKRMETYQ